MAREGTRFFSKQVGQISGTISKPEEAESIFEEAGFEKAEVLLPSDIAIHHQLPGPVSDFQLFAVGYKSGSPVEASSTIEAIPVETDDETQNQ